MYSNGSEEIHTVDNQVMGAINLLEQGSIAPELPRAIHSDETGVLSTGTMYWVIRTGGTGNSQERSCDRSIG